MVGSEEPTDHVAQVDEIESEFKASEFFLVFFENYEDRCDEDKVDNQEVDEKAPPFQLETIRINHISRQVAFLLFSFEFRIPNISARDVLLHSGADRIPRHADYELFLINLLSGHGPEVLDSFPLAVRCHFFEGQVLLFLLYFVVELEKAV